MTAPHCRRAGPDLRLLRAAVFTAACVALSAGGHILASDETVPLWSLGLAAAVLFALAVPLAGRERSLPGIAVSLAVAQTALHCLFGMGQHAAAAWAAGGGMGGAQSETMSLARRLLCNDAAMRLTEGTAREIVGNAGLDPGGSGHGGAHAAGMHGGGGGQGSAVLDASTYSLPMLIGHVLAALAAGWLLRRGDSALWGLARLADAAGAGVGVGVDLRALRAALRYARALETGLGRTTPARRAPRTAYEEECAGPLGVLQHTVIRRGPPGMALAA